MAIGSAMGRDTEKTGQRGFTLIELLLTIVIISILGLIVVGGIELVGKSSRSKRISLTCRVLEAALQRYHAEYNEWPVERDQSEQRTFTDDNYLVFNALREDDDRNYDNLRFIDETTLFTTKGGSLSGEAIPLSQSKNYVSPLVFAPVNKQSDKSRLRYYTVTIDFEYNTVKVEAIEKLPGKKQLSEDEKF